MHTPIVRRLCTYIYISRLVDQQADAEMPLVVQALASRLVKQLDPQEHLVWTNFILHYPDECLDLCARFAAAHHPPAVNEARYSFEMAQSLYPGAFAGASQLFLGAALPHVAGQCLGGCGLV